SIVQAWQGFPNLDLTGASMEWLFHYQPLTVRDTLQNSFPTAITTTLNGSVTASQSTIVVNNTAQIQNFPTDYGFYVLIDNEIMLVVGGEATYTWNVLRQQKNTLPTTHASGAM